MIRVSIPILFVALLVLCGNVGAQEVKRLAVPPTIVDPPWMAERRAAQLEAAEKYRFFHQFSFVDRLGQSGIRFRNQITDESAKHWQPIHYDHGNGVAVADVDGDGLLDVYFTTQSGRNQLWRNLGDGTFADITEASGVGVGDPIGVTASFADIDNDGDLDAFVSNNGQRAHLLRNDGGNANHWIAVKAVGRVSNRDGIGARIEVVSGELVQVEEVRSGSSYLSQNDLRVYFGLGARDRVDRLEIRWPSGIVQTLEALSVNRVHRVEEPISG